MLLAKQSGLNNGLNWCEYAQTKDLVTIGPSHKQSLCTKNFGQNFVFHAVRIRKGLSLSKETKQLKHNLLCTTLLNQGDKRTLITRNYSLNVEEFNSHEITQWWMVTNQEITYPNKVCIDVIWSHNIWVTTTQNNSTVINWVK